MAEFDFRACRYRQDIIVFIGTVFHFLPIKFNSYTVQKHDPTLYFRAWGCVFSKGYILRISPIPPLFVLPFSGHSLFEGADQLPINLRGGI